ncbi:MAG: hypothetical protein U9R72_03995 [Chloroflexota bacterium]|nr:hypothetical protein [Chloroflexota bacterium]
MPKIDEIIREISKAYASYVNLKQEFNDPKANRERMKGYRPIRSHREALQRLIRALYPNEHRVYALRGSYGTGKSHLFLMLANYFDLKPDAPEMEQFFANYAEQDPDGAKKMRNWRGEGRYLVAICRYGIGDDFEATVLRAIEQASEREGFEGLENTHYHEALRRLNTWEEARREGKATGQMYDLFLDALHEQYPGTSLEALREGLHRYEPRHLNVFKGVFQAITGGAFSPEKGNLIEILEDFVSSDVFKERYKGLVVFYDEFDEILKEARLDVSRFQGFAELCRHPEAGMQPVIFYANIHKPLQGYATAFSKADFQVVRARLQEVQLVSQGIEDIIAAIVVPDQESDLWQRLIAPRQQRFIQLVNRSNRAEIFLWRSGADFKERIVEDLYPMHPMATHCLVQLSQEVGSNARSLFTFFTREDQEGCYRDFIAATEIESDGRLNFYTVDRLFTYFKGQLRADNPEPRDAVRRAIRDYHASYRQARKSPGLQLDVDLDPFIDRLLKALLIYKISDVACTFHNLAFGLDLSPEKEDRLKQRLDRLVEEQVLYRDQHDLYEFRQGDVRDFEQLIEAYKTDPKNQPDDLAGAVLDAHKLGYGQRWLEAKEHNAVYYEDKRVRRCFIRAQDLSAETFAELDEAIDEEDRWPDRFEGMALYVLCETMEEVETARQRVEENGSNRLLIGVPQEPIPIRDALLTLEAIKHIRKRPEMQDISIVEQARLNDLLGNEEEGALGRFLELRTRYLQGQELIWFGTKGEVVVSQPDASYVPADRLMDDLYDCRNRLAHGTDFNKIHVKKTGTSNTQLHDAVRELLDLGRDVKIDLDYGDNRGEIRYLKRCLADVGALSLRGVPQGSRRYYRVEHETDKFRQELPALADMVDQVDELEPGETVRIQALINDYAGPPYGQGPVALSLFLAFVIRRFGDALSLKRDPTAVGSVGACSPSFLYDLIDGQYPNAAFERRRITEQERALVDGIYRLFSAEEAEPGQAVMMKDAFAALQTWWDQLTPLAKTTDIYQGEEAASTRRLIALCRGMANEAPHLFLTGDLQRPYGYHPDDAITKESHEAILDGLRRDKERIATQPGQFKEELIETLMDVEAFQVEEDVTVLSDYQRAIEAWYKALDDNQRDRLADWHSGESRALIRHLGQISDLRETLLEDLPADPGFGLHEVDNWTTDRTDDYVSKLKAGVALIAEHRVPVDAPTVDISARETVKDSGGTFERTITYRGPLTVTIDPDPESACAYFTTTGEDPRHPESQRQEVSDHVEHTVDQGNAQVKLVSQAESGKYGRVMTIKLIDHDRRYVIEPYERIPVGEAAPHYFPADRRAFQVALQSLIENAMKFSDLTEEDVKSVIEDLLGQL